MPQKEPDEIEVHAIKKCTWKFDDIKGYYKTECKNIFNFDNIDIREHGFEYCTYCGKQLNVESE